MSSKKILLVTICIFIFVCCGLVIFASKNTNSIEYYMADVELDKGGNITIKETIVINLKSYINYYIRDIGLSKNLDNNPLLKNIKYNNNEVNVVVNDVEVYEGNILEDNVSRLNDVRVKYNGERDLHGNIIECPCTSDYCLEKCKSIYVDRNANKFEGVYTFYYEYILEGMATKYQDCAELNYVMFDSLGYKAKTVAIDVLIPSSGYDKEDVYGYVHSNANGKYTQEGNNRFTITANNVSSSDKLEFRIVFPTDLIDRISEENIINVNMLDKILTYEESLSKETILLHTLYVILTVLTCLIIGGLVAVIIIVYIKYDKEFTPKFDNDYYRELPSNYPPAIMSYLYYFQKTVDEDFSATILNLVRRKYLELNPVNEVVNEKKLANADYELVLLNNDFSGLMSHERELLSFIINEIGDGKKVTFEEIESYGKSYKNAENFENKTRAFKKSIEKDAKNFDFFIDNSKAKVKIAIYGIIGLILGFLLAFIGLGNGLNVSLHAFLIIALSCIYLIYVASIKKRSIYGNEEYAKWKAFRRFLCEFGSLEEYSVLGISMWEEYLVYATSLKVAEKVIDELKVHLPELDTTGGTFIYYGRDNHFANFYAMHRLSRVYQRASYNSMGTITAHNARNTGGGGGHGGGFSGGSSFGGGGGGFRGGR